MLTFEQKYGIEETDAVKAFHKGRRMFCIVDGVLHIAQPKVAYSHAVWFEKRGWITVNDNDAFMNQTVRGFVDAQGDVYFFVGYDFRIDSGTELIFFTHLQELDLKPTANVYGGMIRQSSGGQWPGKKHYGTIKQLLNGDFITKEERQTISYYDQNARKWAEKYDAKKHSFWDDELAQFQRLLPRGNILEIGFGGALEAGKLIKMGYRYTGIDPALQLVEHARKRFPEAQFLESNVYELDSVPGSFDGFWCSAVFLHIPPHNIDHALRAIRRTVKNGAIGFISVARGAGEYFDVDTGRWFYLYGMDEFEALLSENGFAVQSKAVKEKATHRTWLRSWVTFFVRAIDW